MKDEEFLELLNRDSSEGISMAIELYGGAVKTICKSILAGYSSEDIEEAVSDAFLGLWKARTTIRIGEGAGVKVYLYGIARRTALNRKRMLAKQKQTEDIDDVVKAADTNVEEEVTSQMEYEYLHQLILDMKSPDREIFLYRYYQQNTVKEIAMRLELSAKTVENKLTRGRGRLKKQLLQCGMHV